MLAQFISPEGRILNRRVTGKNTCFVNMYTGSILHLLVVLTQVHPLLQVCAESSREDWKNQLKYQGEWVSIEKSKPCIFGVCIKNFHDSTQLP